MQPALLVVSVVLAAALMLSVMRQVRKPTGPLGRRVLRVMNITHAGLTDWGLQFVQVDAHAVVLDVGCGGGRTVQRLAAMASDGRVHGIDYSAASVRASRDANAGAVAAGRVDIQLASVAALPFPECTFDVVTAVETHYYWPDLPANLREIRRVLKPGGVFVLIAETHRGGGRFAAIHGVVMRLLGAAHLSDAEHRALLQQSGFTDVSTMHAPRRTWICATGRRPANEAG